MERTWFIVYSSSFGVRYFGFREAGGVRVGRVDLRVF